MTAAVPEYSLRQSPRAKHVRLKVTREEGLIVVVPKGYDVTKVPAVISRKRVWIEESLRRIGETKRFLEPAPAAHLPESIHLLALGERWGVTYRDDSSRPGIRVRVTGEAALMINGTDVTRDAAIVKLKGWLRRRVRDGLFPIAESLSVRHRLELGGLLVKNQRTRWASYSAQGNLSLNSKLLFLSPELVRYVIIHELCHSVHMHHGPEFWRLVATHEPSYKVLDLELRGAWKRVPQWVF